MALRTLYQSFLHSDMGRLRIIARQWSFEPYAVRHTDLAAELVDAIVDADAVMAVISRLHEEHRAALDDLLRRNGSMPWASFLRRWGPMRDIGMGKMEREELWREPFSAAEALWMLGLVQRDFSDHPGDPIEMAYVPEALSLYMPAPAPFLISPPQPVSLILEKRVVDVNDDLAEELVTWWIAIQKAQLTDSELRASGEFLTQMHAPVGYVADLLHTLSLEQGWVRKNQGQELRLVPEPVRVWLRSDLWMQWSSVARAWVRSTQWNDLTHVQSLHLDPVQDWSPNPLEIRQRLLDFLARCVLDTWYSVEEFIVYIKEYATDFMRPDGNYERWAPRDAHTGRPLRGFESWEFIEGAYIRFVMSGPLFRLGVVDLVDSGDENVGDIFRITDAGAALLGLCDPPHMSIPPEISIDSVGIIDAPARRRYERYQLSRIAQFVHHDNIYRFRVTPSSLKRAQQQHIPLSRIVDFLEQATKQPLPANLGTAMQRVYRNNEGASLECQWLLRLPDPNHEIIIALQDFIVEQLTPTIVVIGEENLDSVLALLLDYGLLADVREM